MSKDLNTTSYFPSKIKMTPVPYQTPTQNPGLRVVKKRTELIVPHNGGELTFVHRPYRPDTHASVGSAILKGNLQRPTMAETASLVHAAFNSDNRYSAEIERIMRKQRLWGYTEISYVLNEGAFFQDDPETRGGMPLMDKSDLEGRLGSRQVGQVVYSDDGTVRFVPFGYTVGEMSSLELSQNPFVIGLAGEEGAGNLAGIANKYSKRPCLWAHDSVNQNGIAVSALNSKDVRRTLNVFGYFRGDLWVGYALGVLK